MGTDLGAALVVGAVAIVAAPLVARLAVLKAPPRLSTTVWENRLAWASDLSGSTAATAAVIAALIFDDSKPAWILWVLLVLAGLATVLLATAKSGFKSGYPHVLFKRVVGRMANGWPTYVPPVTLLSVVLLIVLAMA